MACRSTVFRNFTTVYEFSLLALIIDAVSMGKLFSAHEREGCINGNFYTRNVELEGKLVFVDHKNAGEMLHRQGEFQILVGSRVRS
jgi:hypothetical protein